MNLPVRHSSGHSGLLPPIFAPSTELWSHAPAVEVLARTTAAAATAGADASDASAQSGATAPPGTTTAEDAGLAQAVDADRTRIRIALQPDGDGRWTVELWTRFEDDAGAGDGSSDAGNGTDGADTGDRDASDETADPADSADRDS